MCFLKSSVMVNTQGEQRGALTKADSGKKGNIFKLFFFPGGTSVTSGEVRNNESQLEAPKLDVHTFYIKFSIFISKSSTMGPLSASQKFWAWDIP